MLSNHHNKNISSFRIIEPKQFQQAQQIPIPVAQQIPILSVKSPHINTSTKSLPMMYGVNGAGATGMNMGAVAGAPVSYEHPVAYMSNQSSSSANNHQQFQQRTRNLSDTDSSCIPEVVLVGKKLFDSKKTTSESGISDLDMSEKCNCCPYGYHIDVDFVTFLQTLGGKNLNKQLKKIQRKRNERLQRSMEYVIDEVERIRQINEESNSTGGSPHTNARFNSTYENTNYQRSIVIPPTLKQTINKIDQELNENNEIFSDSNGNINLNSEAARKLLLLECNKSFGSVNGNINNNNSTASIQRNKSSSHNVSNASNSLGYQRSSSQNLHTNALHLSSSSLPPAQNRNVHLVQSQSFNLSSNQFSRPTFHQQQQHQTQQQHYLNQQVVHQPTHNHQQHAEIKLIQQPRRSYSSCAEAVNEHGSQSSSNCVFEARRCMSNRTSPIRANVTNVVNAQINLPYRQIRDVTRRSRSANTRSKSKSRSPCSEQQYYKREIKINLAAPKRPSSRQEVNEEHHLINEDEVDVETKTVTTTVVKPPSTPPVIQQTSRSQIMTSSLLTLSQPEVQEEVLLNLFSCNNSGTTSSESSESLVEIETQSKLKINEVYEKMQQQQEEKKVESKRVHSQQQLILEKKLMELEKKLQKIPELEIKNNILLEEKQILIKQLLNMKQTQTAPPTPQPKPVEPAKVYRSIGCNSADVGLKRDVGVECKTSTREVGVFIDEPREEIAQMQTIITTLRDKLNEQTLIMQQQLVKPQTRDVAIMHVVDKVEEPPPPKPELRDVAINHQTVIENNKELIEKQTQIINTYIGEIEQLRIENVRLSTNLEELIKKHTKHVITRGTHAPEQPVLYSVGTNTKRTSTRDVQVMFTPKSRDVSLSTDKFYHTRDVGLVCNIENAEHRLQIEELNEIKRKYELMVEESIKNKKAYRDVNTMCNLDFKESRDVSLGCNMYPTKEYRDVSLKCNLDEELRQVRDVCIGCQLDKKPEQKDANIYVNTIEPVVIPPKRDFSVSVQMEDYEKLDLIKEIAELRKPKPSRDVSISFDQRTRFVENLVKNQSSSIEHIKTFSRHVNTEARPVRDSSCGPTFDWMRYSDKGCQASDQSQQEFTQMLVTQKEQIEFERNSLINANNQLRTRMREIEEQLNIERKRTYEINQQQLQQQQQTNKQIVEKTITTSTIELEPIVKRRESEIEHHKITRTEPTKRTQEEILTLSASLCTNPGEKQMEKSVWTSKTVSQIGATSSGALLKNEIIIPISNDQENINTTTTTTSSTSALMSVTQTATSATTTTSTTSSSSNYTTCGEMLLSPVKSQMTSNISSIQVNLNEQNGAFVSETTEQRVYKDGELIEKNISEKVEMKKPKGILKSSLSGGISSSNRLASEGTETMQVQKKALTFGENEILENFTSEQSGSDFSLEENSQVGALLSEHADGYLTSTITYETPIVECIDSSTLNEEENTLNDLNTLTNTNTNKIRRIKMEKANEITTNEYDDYELQEKYCKSELVSTTDSSSRSSLQRRFQQQEEDANESNVLNYVIEDDNCGITDFELELELHIACAILNESLYEPLKADKNKVAKALTLIQQDWFNLAAHKNSNPALVEEHLNAFYSRFSNLLLERIVNMADANHNTVLHYSVSTGNFEIVNLLLDTKVCDVNAQNRAGYTSIMLAALVPVKDDYERMTLKRLFSEGNVNIKSTDSGQTALMLAVRHGNKDAVSLLLEAGADCNSQDKEGSTALMAACEHGHIDIVRILLDNTNCDPDIKDNDGETAFDIAKNKNRNDIIVLLYAHSSKLRSHHPAIQFSKSRPRIGSNGSQR